MHQCDVGILLAHGSPNSHCTL